MSLFLHSRPVLPVKMSMFWSHNGSESVYKNNVSRDSTFKDSEHQTGHYENTPNQIYGKFHLQKNEIFR